MTTLFVAGEGSTEIGRWALEANYRQSRPTDGVLAELFRKKRGAAEVIGGRQWKQAAKYRVQRQPDSEEDDPRLRSAEQRALRIFAHFAQEAGADQLVWARDRDNDPKREPALAVAQAALRERYRDELIISGGVAKPALESWIVALAALHKKPDELSRGKLKELVSANDLDSEETMVELVRTTELDTVSSPSLIAWLAQL